MLQICCSNPAAGSAAAPPGVLHGIFGWWPVLWTIRAGLLILLVSLLYIFVLNVLKFFRPSSIREVVTGPLPRLRQVGGKIAGVEATASLAVSDASLTRQVDEVNQGVNDLVRYLNGLAAHIGYAAPGEMYDDQARAHQADDRGDAGAPGGA